MRKGMGKGKGKGYKNIVGKDPMVHSQSRRGIKQPQRIPRTPKMFTTKSEESEALQKLSRSLGQRIKHGWKYPQGSGFIEDDIVSIGVNSDGSIAYEFTWGSQNILPSDLNLREQEESINWLRKRKVKPVKTQKNISGDDRANYVFEDELF